MMVSTWMRALLRVAPVLLAAIGFVSCAGKQKPAEAPPVEETSDSSEPRGPVMDVSAEIGGMDESAVTRAFEKSLGGLEACLRKGARKNEFLGGDVAFYLKIDQSGGIAENRLEQSTLGDRSTEKCMLAVLQSQAWPKPVGGKAGEARKSFTFDPVTDSRPAVSMPADDLGDVLADLSDELGRCRSGGSDRFVATLYVRKDGRPLSVGVTSPSASTEALDCVAEVLLKAAYPSPGSWTGKLQLEL
jgi:hypothetical protein